MSGYFTGMDESLGRTALWFAVIVAVTYVGLVVIHTALLLVLRWTTRPTIPRAKARKIRGVDVVPWDCTQGNGGPKSIAKARD